MFRGRGASKELIHAVEVAIYTDNVEECKYLLAENLHGLEKLILAVMTIFNRELAHLIWSFVRQSKVDINASCLRKSMDRRSIFGNDSTILCSPLTFAAELGKLEVLKLLLKIPSLNVNGIRLAPSWANGPATALQIATRKQLYHVTRNWSYSEQFPLGFSCFVQSVGLITILEHNN